MSLSRSTSSALMKLRAARLFLVKKILEVASLDLLYVNSLSSQAFASTLDILS